MHPLAYGVPSGTGSVNPCEINATVTEPNLNDTDPFHFAPDFPVTHSLSPARHGHIIKVKSCAGARYRVVLRSRIRPAEGHSEVQRTYRAEDVGSHHYGHGNTEIAARRLEQQLAVEIPRYESTSRQGRVHDSHGNG